MGKIRFFILILGWILGTALGSSLAIAGTEEAKYGCLPWCTMMHENDARALDRCLIITQQQGYCGKPPGDNTVDEAPTPLPRTSRPDDACDTNYNGLLAQCDSAVQSLSPTCSSSPTAKLNNAKNTSGSYDSCKQASALTSSAKSSLTTYVQQCTNVASSCRSTCAALTTYINNNPTCFTGSGAAGVTGLTKSAALSAANSSALRCDAYQTKVADAQSLINSYSTTNSESENCAESTAGGGGAEEEKKDDGSLAALANIAAGLLSDSPPETPEVPRTYCQANPSAIGCAGASVTNCLDPAQMRTNKVCVCAANPNDPMCGSAQSAASDMNATGGSIDSSSRLAPSSSEGLGDLGNLPSIQQGPSNPGGPGDVIEGRQGSSNPVGEAGGGNGGKGFKAATGPADSDPLLRGQPVMGGGGGMRGMNVPGRNVSGSAVAGARVGSGGKENTDNSPDLRRFLPGGMNAPKGAAGVSGPDGITGPHSDIWLKIQNRYNVLSPSLMP